MSRTEGVEGQRLPETSLYYFSNCRTWSTSHVLDMMLSLVLAFHLFLETVCQVAVTMVPILQYEAVKPRGLKAFPY